MITSYGETYGEYDEACVNTTHRASTWVADTSAAFHITHHVDFFSSYSIGDYGCEKMDHGQLA